MSACPECADIKTKVMQSWVLKNGWTVRRRRCIYGCNHLWLTYEVPCDALTLDGDDELLQPIKKYERRKK